MRVVLRMLAALFIALAMVIMSIGIYHAQRAPDPFEFMRNNVREQYVITRLDTSNNGERVWVDFESLTSLNEQVVTNRFRQVMKEQGEGHVRLEWRAVAVIAGPVK